MSNFKATHEFAGIRLRRIHSGFREDVYSIYEDADGYRYTLPSHLPTKIAPEVREGEAWVYTGYEGDDEDDAEDPVNVVALIEPGGLEFRAAGYTYPVDDDFHKNFVKVINSDGTFAREGYDL